jgi:hypothetical protein
MVKNIEEFGRPNQASGKHFQDYQAMEKKH